MSRRNPLLHKERSAVSLTATRRHGVTRRVSLSRAAGGAQIIHPSVSTSDTRWLIADRKGSIAAVATPAGSTSAINLYDEYGIPGSSNSGRFQYDGQPWIPEAGLYHARARAYSPTLGRFLQTDPIGYQGGQNLYGFVAGDPVNASDPTGTTLALPNFFSGLINGFFSGITSLFAPPSQGGLQYSAPPAPEPAPSRGKPAPSDNVISEVVITSKKPPTDPEPQSGGIVYLTFNNPDQPNGIFNNPVSIGHSYETANNKVCGRDLSATEMADLLRRFAVPGSNGVPSESGINFASADGLPGGFVETAYSAGGTQVTNTTTRFHFLVGSVTRNIFATGEGTYLHTSGTGNAGPGAWSNFRDIVNQISGPVIFNITDAQAAKYAKSHYSGC